MRLARRSAIFAVLFLSMTLAIASLPARAAVPSGGQLNFTVLREGDEIGRHVLSFEKAGDDLTVNIRTKIAVKVLFVTAYSFDHEGREVWRNGHLVTLASHTNDDGTEHTLAVQANGSELAVNGDGQLSKAALGIIPASLWHEGILAGGAILNTLYGKQMNITVRDAGMENLMVSGRTVAARHYIIEGDLQRELWFDGDQVLAKVRFKGKDGSKIEYVRR